MAQIDIIMPLFNKVNCVARAIHSIQQQSMQNWRLIVVNDGSTDKSEEIVHNLKDERIILIHQKNQGPGAARNTGIARANADWLAFLDADDEWYPWYLDNALAAAKESNSALVATMYYEWPKQIDMTRHWAKRGVRYGKYSFQGDEDPAKAESLILFLHVGNCLIRTELAKKYDRFYADNKCLQGEDTIFFMRIAINEAFRIIGPPAVCHHREDSSLSCTEDRPLPPLLSKPETVLRYCSGKKRKLALSVIECIALRKARNWARNGFKNQAIDLVSRYPQVKRYKRLYLRCRYEIALSPLFRHWVKFKCAVGPPVRLFLKSLAWKLDLMPKIPDITPKTHADGIDTKKISKKFLKKP